MKYENEAKAILSFAFGGEWNVIGKDEALALLQKKQKHLLSFLRQWRRHSR